MTQLCGTCRPVRKRGSSDAYDDLKAKADELLVFMQEKGTIEMCEEDRIIRVRGASLSGTARLREMNSYR
jgi:hypothetical protein